MSRKFILCLWLGGMLSCQVNRINGDQFVEVGRFTTATNFRDIELVGLEIWGVTAGLAGSGGALRVIEGFSAPQQIRVKDLYGPCRLRVDRDRVYVLYNYALGGIWRSGVRVFDTLSLEEMSNPSTWWNSPTEGMDLVGTKVFLASENPNRRDYLGLQIYDLLGPNQPKRLGVYTNLDDAVSVRVVDNRAYVADGAEGVKILDVTDPTVPKLWSAWDPGEQKTVRGLFVEGSILYVAGNGFWILGVFPVMPQLLGALEEEARSVTVANGVAYVGGDGGVRAYDVRDPSHPRLLTRYHWPTQVYDVEYMAPSHVLAAGSSGVVVLRHDRDIPLELRTVLRRLTTTGVANLNDDLDGLGNPTPLIPAADPTVLQQQPEITRGLVADGVTPLLIQVSATGLTEPIRLQSQLQVTNGSIAGGMAAHWRVLNNGVWETNDTVQLTPDKPYAFGRLDALQPWQVVFESGSRELSVDLSWWNVAKGEDFPSAAQAFVLRRPPVFAFSPYGCGEEFLAELRLSHPDDFICLSSEVGTLSARMMQFQGEWAITRPDAIAHGITALALRRWAVGNTEIHFRSRENLNRGVWRRLVSIGAPHNGSQAIPFLEAFLKRLDRMIDEEPKDRVWPLAALLPSHMLHYFAQYQDPFFESESRMLSFDALDPRGWELGYEGHGLRARHDPAAKFHFMGTTMNPSHAKIFQMSGLRGLRNHLLVFPMGSDGLSGLDSQVPVRAVDNASILEGDWAHSTDEVLFGASQGQTSSRAAAQRATEVLDDPDEHLFAAFNPPPLLSDREWWDLDAAGRSSAEAQFIEIRVRLMEPLNVQSYSQNAKNAQRFLCQLLPPADLPPRGDPVWHAELWGTNGATTAGLVIQPDLSNASQMTLTVPELLVGDVVLYASYPTAENRTAFGRPSLVQSAEPTGTSLAGIDFLPTNSVYEVGSFITPSIMAIYSNGMRLPRWITTDEIQVNSTDANVLGVTNARHWQALAAGRANVTLAYRGYRTTRILTVTNPYPAISFQAWRSNHFTASQLDDPTVSHPSIDVDRDGMNLVMEYATAGDPRVRDTYEPIWLARPRFNPGEGIQLVIRVSRSLFQTQVILERSSDLQQWIDYLDLGHASSSPLLRDTIEAGPCRLLTVLPPQPSSTGQFLRLKVICPTEL